MVKGKVNRERAMRREDIGQEMKMRKNKLRIITDWQEYLAGKTCSQNRTDEKLFYRCVSFFFLSHLHMKWTPVTSLAP